jgi:hypothetical protein
MDPKTAPRQHRSCSEPCRAAGSPTGISPLEFALFLQSALDFQPGVIAFENILKWRDSDRDQEQVFLDQAMRVPKLMLASDLGAHTDPDAPWAEIRGFTQVEGRRGDLPSFSGIDRQPNEDLRLISTAGFVNLPEEVASDLRVPLLFLYRGEVIPSFTLQAILLWLRATPADVKIVLGVTHRPPAGPQDSDQRRWHAAGRSCRIEAGAPRELERASARRSATRHRQRRRAGGTRFA